MNSARVNIEILLENQTATYFHRSRLFTYDIMKNFNLATFNRKKSIMTACMPLTPLSTIFNKRRVGAFSLPNSQCQSKVVETVDHYTSYLYTYNLSKYQNERYISNSY